MPTQYRLHELLDVRLWFGARLVVGAAVLHHHGDRLVRDVALLLYVQRLVEVEAFQKLDWSRSSAAVTSLNAGSRRSSSNVTGDNDTTVNKSSG
jgi:hypothetical protein